MPCISGDCGPAGILTQVAIFKDQRHAQQLASPPTGALPPPLTLYNALFDTGASATCISPKVVTDLGLAPVGKVPMISASHVTPTNQYIFWVGMPIGFQQAPTGSVSGTFGMFPDISGLEFQPAAVVYDILIGMDIIMRGVLTVDFSRHWSFSF
jgi:hypothetical protein